MNNTTLNLAVFVLEPFLNNCSLLSLTPYSKMCPDPGYYGHLMHRLLEFLNIDYQIIPYPNLILGSYVNDTWTGALGLIDNGTVDTVPFAYSFESTRLNHFRFTNPVEFSPYVYVFKKPTFGATGLIMLTKSFNPSVWIASLLSVLTFWLAFSISRMPKQKITMHFLTTFWDIIRYVLLQCYKDMKQKTFSGLLMYILLSGFVLIMTSMYQNVILSRLLLEDPHRFSEDDVINYVRTKKFTLIKVEKDNAYTGTLESEADLEHFQKVREALKYNPPLYLSPKDNLSEYLSRGAYVYPARITKARYLIEQDCSLTTVKIHSNKLFSGFVFRKNSSTYLVDRFNLMLINLRERIEGVIDKYNQPRRCTGRAKRKIDDLSLDSINGCFVLIGFCLLIALIGLSMELCWYSFKQKLITRRTSVALDIILL